MNEAPSDGTLRFIVHFSSPTPHNHQYCGENLIHFTKLVNVRELWEENFGWENSGCDQQRLKIES